MYVCTYISFHILSFVCTYVMQGTLGMVLFGFVEVPVKTTVDWKSITVHSGALFVMINLAVLMQKLHVCSWDLQGTYNTYKSLVVVQIQFGWTIYNAQAQKHGYPIAPGVTGVITIVDTVRMLELHAVVSEGVRVTYVCAFCLQCYRSVCPSFCVIM